MTAPNVVFDATHTNGHSFIEANFWAEVRLNLPAAKMVMECWRTDVSSEEIVSFLRGQFPGGSLTSFSLGEYNALMLADLGERAPEATIHYLLLRAGGWVTYMVAAHSETTTALKIAALRDFAPDKESEVTSDQVPVSFTMLSNNGGVAVRERPIDCDTWDSISDNYPRSLRSELTQIMGFDRPQLGGKIVLWHGPPGTGKTHAIRSLMREWHSWCHPIYVTDPERFFNEPKYLTSVIFDSEDPYEDFLIENIIQSEAEEKERKWKLVVIEDADEFLDQDAKERTGQALSRLLNVGDGLIGQGLHLLTLITTNVQMESIHGAVVRKGRCAANLNFDPFPAAQANEWLLMRGSEVTVSEPTTLADLYEIVSPNHISAIAESPANHPVGQYL